MTTASSSPIRADDGVVTITGPAVVLLYRATLALIAKHSRDGLRASPALLEARRILYRAAVSQPRQGIDTTSPAPACCNGQHGDLTGIAEAAEVLPEGARLRAQCPPRGHLLRPSPVLASR